MEASALRQAARAPVLSGLSPHLRLQSDERLVALVRRGHHGAFEALLKRYQPRLLAFCRHMLGSNEDAEDVLQEVFASAYSAICQDERPIKARPWLYRIARNRCLNHLRRPQDSGRESMDVFERAEGATAADTVHRREEFREIVSDVQELPEAQRAALLLREVNALSYDQIAHAMETTVPSVKSLLVRARVSLAEAAEARRLTCAEVRLELGQAAEGIAKASPPARRHVRSCPRCRAFKRDLRRTSRVLAAVYPVGGLLAVRELLAAKLAGGPAGAATAAAEGPAVATGAALGGAAGALSTMGGSVVAKAAAGLVAAALVTAGAVEIRHGGTERDAGGATPAVAEEGAAAGRPGSQAEALPGARGAALSSPSTAVDRTAPEPVPTPPAPVEHPAPNTTSTAASTPPEQAAEPPPDEGYGPPASQSTAPGDPPADGSAPTATPVPGSGGEPGAGDPGTDPPPTGGYTTGGAGR